MSNQDVMPGIGILADDKTNELSNSPWATLTEESTDYCEYVVTVYDDWYGLLHRGVQELIA